MAVPLDIHWGGWKAVGAGGPGATKACLLTCLARSLGRQNQLRAGTGETSWTTLFTSQSLSLSTCLSSMVASVQPSFQASKLPQVFKDARPQREHQVGRLSPFMIPPQKSCNINSIQLHSLEGSHSGQPLIINGRGIQLHLCREWCQIRFKTTTPRKITSSSFRLNSVLLPKDANLTNPDQPLFT